MLGALVGLGVPEEEATYYDTQFQTGRTIVTVRADERSAEAWDVLARHGAYDFERQQAADRGHRPAGDTVLDGVNRSASGGPAAPIACLSQCGGSQCIHSTRDHRTIAGTNTSSTGTVNSTAHSSRRSGHSRVIASSDNPMTHDRERVADVHRAEEVSGLALKVVPADRTVFVHPKQGLRRCFRPDSAGNADRGSLAIGSASVTLQLACSSPASGPGKLHCTRGAAQAWHSGCVVSTVERDRPIHLRARTMRNFIVSSVAHPVCRVAGGRPTARYAVELPAEPAITIAARRWNRSRHRAAGRAGAGVQERLPVTRRR